LAEQQVLKNGGGNKNTVVGGIVSFCVLKCYEMIKTNLMNMCVKTSKTSDRRLEISVLLLYLYAVATVIAYQTFLSDTLLYAG
jgi:hypothetical protein